MYTKSITEQLPSTLGSFSSLHLVYTLSHSYN